MRPRIETEIEIPDAVWNAVRDCEIYCVAGCCGENAFELFPENMVHWVNRSTPAEIVQAELEIDELIRQLAKSGPTAGLKYFSGDDPNGPKAWLEDVRECLIEATSPASTQGGGSPIFRHATAEVRVLTGSETYRGNDFPPKPLRSGRIDVILPERPLTILLSLAVEQVLPGQTASASLRFPLPRRIQPHLSVGGALELDHHRGRKTVHATIMELTA